MKRKHYYIILITHSTYYLGPLTSQTSADELNVGSSEKLFERTIASASMYGKTNTHTSSLPILSHTTTHDISFSGEGLFWQIVSIFLTSRRIHSSPPSLAKVAAVELSGSHPVEVQNLVQDNWTTSNRWNLIIDLKGRVKLEDAGFDWKVLESDVEEVDFVAWVCDQDAYACSGQKCPAQSILFMHENRASSRLIPKMKDLSERKKQEDLTIDHVLTVTTESMREHIEKLLEIPEAKLLFRSEPLENHSISKVYGALKATTVFIPIHEILKDYNFEPVTREIFGLFQIITDYKQDELQMVLDACARMHVRLTAEVVSNDPLFLQDVLGRSVNGTTYAGIQARTTGAPQNHWFGPAGDPWGAEIRTPEEIKLVWSCHRKIIFDIGPLPMHWEFHLEDKVAFWAAGNDMNQFVGTNVEEPLRSIAPVRFTYVRWKVLKSHEPRKWNEMIEPTKEANAK